MHNNSNSSEPKKWGAGESLAIQRPRDWRFLRLTLLFLIGYFIFGEIFFRLDSVRGVLTGPRIGSRHSQFEIQVARLEKLIDEGEPIDCIFLGNSMVWLGVDPLVVNKTFREQTGQEIHCFNFGISALPASSAGQIAPMLIERYHPKLLIYGTFARDYAVPIDAEDAYVVTTTPWLEYQNGKYSLQGWLYSHSSVFRYSGHMRDLLLMRYLENVFPQKNAPRYQNFGLDPKFNVRLDVTKPPDYEDVGNKEMLKWLGSFEFHQENLNGLQKILRQSEHGVEVIIIEMPFHENVYKFFTNGEQDYDTYVQRMDSITATNHTPFWRMDSQLTLTTDDWWDYFHLNLTGADLFSEWLGAKLANSYLNGNLILSSTVTP